MGQIHVHDDMQPDLPSLASRSAGRSGAAKETGFTHWYHSLQENIKPTYVGFFVCEKPQDTVVTSAT